ncbi:MAG: hypothetical protein ACR2QM_06730 [Longimicrobiales bacterium]
MRSSVFRMLTLLVAAIGYSACGDDDPTSPPPPAAAMNLTLALTGAEPLTDGAHYEGWAIVGGAPVSTGKFNVSAAGGLEDLTGAPITVFTTATDISTATAIVISIEPDGDTDATPSDTKFMAGAVASLAAPLSVGSSDALGDDFTGAAGKYILASPTDDPTANDNSGIWFLDNSSGTPEAGLTVATLPAGWQYEGWVVIDGTPVSTGRFTDPAAADLAAPHSESTNPAPPFPGEDFLLNAPTGLTFPTDIAGATAVISIEPEPDFSAMPFTLKPLTHAIDAAATTGVVYDMDNSAGDLPTGSATISS